MITPLNRGRITFLIAGLVLLVGLMPGQGIDSTLVGTVTDSSGAVVPGSQVTATNRDTGVVTSRFTNRAGEYRMEHLPVGSYDVAASAPSFAPRTSANVTLQLNHVVRVDLPLEVATATTTVEVTEAPAPLDIASSHLENTYDARGLITLPAASSGSGFLNLSLLGGGVASSGGLGQGTGPSIAGQRPSANRYYVEGADNNSYFVTGPLSTPSNEALSEFTVLQNHYGSQFGGAPGGIFDAIVKSGGNQIHGSLYEYLENRNLNALDAKYARQGATSPPRYDSNRLGATFGGPILKNKLFYFGSFEYNPTGNAFTPLSVVEAPTASGFQALNAIPSLSKTNLGVLSKYLPAAPVPTDSIQVLNATIPVGPLSIIGPSYVNQYSAVGSIDWDVSDRDRVRGRYLYTRYSGIDTSQVYLPAFFAKVPDNTHLVSLSEYHTFSATAQNEFRAAYSRNFDQRSAADVTFPGLTGFPTLYFDDIGGGQFFGPNPGYPYGQVQDELQLSDSITKTFSRHTIKVGYDFRDVILSSSFVSYPNGYYWYSSLERYLSDLTPDLFGQRFLGANGPLTGAMPLGFLQNAAYLQDDYRILPNLTLNLGVRYEYVAVPVISRAQGLGSIADVPGVITFREPRPSGTDWSPSVGFAYSPGKNGVWAIRGGFSRAFDMPYGNLAANTAPAFYGSGLNVNGDAPGFLANGGLNREVGLLSTPASARAATTGYTPDQTRPYALTYTLGVQRLLGHDYTLEARYTGTRGVHLLVQEQLNSTSAVTASNSIPTFLSMPSAATLSALPLTTGALKAIQNNPLKQYGFTNRITALEPEGNSKYNGLVLQVTKRYSRNFSYLAAYTWSHLTDDSTANINFTALTPRRPQNFGNLSSEWASSILDRRHRLTISPIFDVRPFSRRGWALKNLVGNWNLAFTYTYESPEYGTVQSGVDSNLNGDSATDRAIVNPNGISGTGSSVTGYDRNGNAVAPTSTAIVAYVANNPNARYLVAGAGAYANGGRNTMPFDPINNIDASVRKVFSITEQRRFEIGAQFYNLLNHPQFVPGYLNDVAPSPSMNRAFLIPGNSSFGQYQQFFASNSRYIQLLARFTF
ncbi:MAG TPA: TonB-dependent receptor [Bryobacteraceae bacterium]|jgi:hypothetical protein|nr:TonB-dependent receptor [Bryobacteraceae bacterium]